ncbi:MAG: hypothetical protein ACOZQL_40970 [Myxococcota bacterium]
MFKTSFRLAALTVAMNLSACAPPETTPEEDQSYVARSALSVELGPEGGDLLAPDDSPLAGAMLHVPAGALSARTTLTLDLRTDAKSLQGDAERVGPQFVVGPADVTFAKPIELTVPIDPATLAMHGQTHEDCKVWFRNGGEWSRLERKTSTEGTITVELASPGVAAAGVLARTGRLDCVANPKCLAGLTPIIPAAQRCTSPTGYCIVKLPTPRHAPLERNAGFNVVGRKLYYAHAPADDQLSVVTYDLDTGDSEVLGTVNTNQDPFTDQPIAVAADGSAWLPLGSFGNVRFKRNTVPFRFDFETPTLPRRDGVGVVVTGGTTLRFLKNPNAQMTDGTTLKELPRTDTSSSRLSFSPRHAVPGGVLARRIIDFYAFTFDDTVATEVFNSNAYQAGGASFRNAGIATLIHNPDEIRWQTATRGEVRIAVPPEQQLLAFDADDLVYVAAPLTPAVSIANEEGGLAVLPLTNAPEGTAEYRAMRPRALISVPGRGELIVQVDGAVTPRQREFYLLRKSN